MFGSIPLIVGEFDYIILGRNVKLIQFSLIRPLLDIRINKRTNDYLIRYLGRSLNPHFHRVLNGVGYPAM